MVLLLKEGPEDRGLASGSIDRVRAVVRRANAWYERQLAGKERLSPFFFFVRGRGSAFRRRSVSQE